MPNDPPEGYVSSAEACRALGISDRTLRRRVQAGALAGEYVARPQGSVLYVKLPDGYTAPQAATDGDAASDTAEPTRQDAALVSMLLERIDVKDAAILAATERAVRAEAELQAAREAAKTAEVAHTSALKLVQAQLDQARAEVERLRRRTWWRRLLGRE